MSDLRSGPESQKRLSGRLTCHFCPEPMSVVDLRLSSLQLLTPQGCVPHFTLWCEASTREHALHKKASTGFRIRIWFAPVEFRRGTSIPPSLRLLSFYCASGTESRSLQSTPSRKVESSRNQNSKQILNIVGFVNPATLRAASRKHTSEALDAFSTSVICAPYSDTGNMSLYRDRLSMSLCCITMSSYLSCARSQKSWWLVPNSPYG